MSSKFLNITLLLSYGRTANRMIQRTFIQSETTEYKHKLIIQPGIPEWGIRQTFGYGSFRRGFLIIARIFPTLVKQIRTENRTINSGRSFLCIVSDTGLNVERLSASRLWAQNEFFRPSIDSCTCSLSAPIRNTDQYLVAHVRLGDIWNHKEFKRRDYLPLPIAYYAALSKHTGKPIAFLIEDQHNSKYAAELLSACPNSVILPAGCIHCDFRTLFESDSVAIATSTFSWFATWISSKTQKIYIPVYGFFDQKVRPDINLVDTSDPRNSYVHFGHPEFSREQGFVDWLFSKEELALTISHSPLESND